MSVSEVVLGQIKYDSPPQIASFFFYLYPVTLHSLALSIFASLLAPFGGFFASGFKRAFKVKVTGSLGILDMGLIVCNCCCRTLLM